MCPAGSDAWPTPHTPGSHPFNGRLVDLTGRRRIAVLLVSHVDGPLEASDVKMTRARGKRTAEGEPAPGTAPAAEQQKVVWRIFECGHRCARTTLVAPRAHVSKS